MTSLAQAITQAALSGAAETLVQPFAFGDASAGAPQNQLLFFFKPEVFTIADPQKSVALVELALDQLAAFGVEVAGSLVISGPRLARMEAMDRHYGFINRVSRDASGMLSDADKVDIRDRLGAANHTPVMGGHELLGSPLGTGFDPASLDAFWARKASVRIRGGMYAQLYTIEGQDVVLLNGFHPQQLAHFTADGRAIGLLLLHTDLPWSVMRGRMLGGTFPEKAAPGSLRRTLFEQAATNGLGTVGISNNCAHLSAGPFEGLFELNNFLSDSERVAFEPSVTRVAQQMQAVGLNAAHILHALDNPTASIHGQDETLFDATEEQDSLSAVALFARFFRG